MNKIDVLLVEDEETLAMIIKDTLEAQGFNVVLAANGEEGLALLSNHTPHVVVTDVMMPRMDGYEMVRRLRMTDPDTPVLFLTARSAVADVVQGFETGGNDYLRKPFGMQELIVRIQALVARSPRHNTPSTAPTPTGIRIGSYVLDTVRQTLEWNGQCLELSHRETEILRLLGTNVNEVVKTQDILLQLWGDDNFFNARSLQVFITKLRHKLAHDPHVKIFNVRGIGYKLMSSADT